MKKTFLIIASAIITYAGTNAQPAAEHQLQAKVNQLGGAANAADYEQLANDFLQIAHVQKTNWLSWYYAAFCNAKVGWLKQDDPESIEPFADKAEEQITQARALLDTATQKKELSEVYCVLSMLNRAKVFMNPATYGREYGPKADRYTNLALATNPDNPRALYMAGWEKFATPKAWGGDKQKAKHLLETAKQKLNDNPSTSPSPNWGTREVEELLSQLK